VINSELSASYLCLFSYFTTDNVILCQAAAVFHDELQRIEATGLDK
jgi:hypothetical protein